MQNVLETTGTVKQLNEAIVAPRPNHADIKLVKHGNSKAFALVSDSGLHGERSGLQGPDRR